MTSTQIVLSLRQNLTRLTATLILKNSAHCNLNLIHIFLLGVLLCCFCHTIKAQEIKELKKGEFIILYPDGTLSSFDAENPVHIRLRQDYEKNKKSKKNQSPGLQKPELEISDPVKRKAQVAKLLQIVNLELEKGILVDSAYLRRKRALSKLKSEQLILEPDLKKLKALHKSLRKAKSEEKIARRVFAEAQKNSRSARKELQKYLFDLSGKPPYQPLYKKNSLHGKIVSFTNKHSSKLSHTIPSVKQAKKKAKQHSKRASDNVQTFFRKLFKIKPKSKVPLKAKLVRTDQEMAATPDKIIRLKSADDVMQNPPEVDCNVLFEGKDDFSGKYRKELSPVTVFSYTDVSMKKFYEKDDFLTCESYFSVIENSYKYLTFQFTMASENVQSSYGWLEKDNLIQIRFLDGSTLNLYNSRTDRGTVNTVNHSTSYRAYCIIGSREEKMLLAQEADAIRVQWSTGTEDYEIFDVDIFADQLRCLLGKSKLPIR